LGDLSTECGGGFTFNMSGGVGDSEEKRKQGVKLNKKELKGNLCYLGEMGGSPSSKKKNPCEKGPALGKKMKGEAPRQPPEGSGVAKATSRLEQLLGSLEKQRTFSCLPRHRDGRSNVREKNNVRGATSRDVQDRKGLRTRHRCGDILRGVRVS